MTLAKLIEALQAEVARMRRGYRIELGNLPANHPDHDGSSGF